MPRTDLPIVRRTAVFVRELRDGRPVYIEQPYIVVDLNWGDTSANATYVQPTFGTWSRALGKKVFDDVQFFDRPPAWAPFPGSGL